MQEAKKNTIYCCNSLIKGIFNLFISIFFIFITSCNSDFYELLNDIDQEGREFDSSKIIISFQLLAIENPSLSNDVIGEIVDQRIILSVPYSTNLHSLVPSIDIIGKTINPESGTKLSFTENGATVFTVTAHDNSKISYDVTISKDDLIEDIHIPSQEQGPIYEISENFSTGIELYSDEVYTINSEVPDYLKDNNFIKPANSDKIKTEDNYLTITITENSIIYVAYDITYLISLPNWLNSWEYKYESFSSSNGRTYNIYSKEFSAGDVILGANWAAGAANSFFDPYPDQYIVVARSKANRTFIKGINFNGPSLTIEGESWLSQKDAELEGFSTDASNTYYTSGINPFPAADANTSAMLSSSIYESASPSPKVSFEINQILENGNYEVYLYFIENTYTFFPPYRSYNININGNAAAVNIGEKFDYLDWSKLGPFSAIVNNGNLVIKFTENNNAPEISGMSLYKRE